MTQTVSTHTTTSSSDGTSTAAPAAAPSFTGDGHQLGGGGGGGQPPDKNNKLNAGQLDDSRGLKKVTPAAKAGTGTKSVDSNASARLPPPFEVKPEHLTGASQTYPYGSELGGFSGRSKGFGGVTLSGSASSGDQPRDHDDDPSKCYLCNAKIPDVQKCHQCSRPVCAPCRQGPGVRCKQCYKTGQDLTLGESAGNSSFFRKPTKPPEGGEPPNPPEGHEPNDGGDNEKSKPKGKKGRNPDGGPPGGGDDGGDSSGDDDDPDRLTRRGFMNLLRSASGGQSQRTTRQPKKEDSTIGIEWVPTSAGRLPAWLREHQPMIAAASCNPDACITWITEVLAGFQRGDEITRFADSEIDDFVGLDLKIYKEMMKCIKKANLSELERRVVKLSENLVDSRSLPKGRQVIWLMLEYYRLECKQAHIKDLDKLNRIALKDGHEKEWLDEFDRYIREAVYFTDDTFLDFVFTKGMVHSTIFKEEVRKYNEAEDSEDVRKFPYRILRPRMERMFRRRDEEKNYKSHLGTWGSGPRTDGPAGGGPVNKGKKQKKAEARAAAAQAKAAAEGYVGTAGKGKGKKGKGKGKGKKGAAGLDSSAAGGDKKGTPCFAYMKGTCTQSGKTCDRSHDDKVCNAWMAANPEHEITKQCQSSRKQQGAAAKKVAAAYAKAKPRAKATPKGGKKPCWFKMFGKDGCTHGKDCQFDHSKAALDAAKKLYDKDGKLLKPKGKGKGKKGGKSGACLPGAAENAAADDAADF